MEALQTQIVTLVERLETLLATVSGEGSAGGRRLPDGVCVDTFLLADFPSTAPEHSPAPASLRSAHLMLDTVVPLDFIR